MKPVVWLVVCRRRGEPRRPGDRRRRAGAKAVKKAWVKKEGMWNKKDSTPKTPAQLAKESE